MGASPDVWQLFWFVVTTIASELLRPKPADAKPSALGDFQVPTAEEGRAIPVAMGRCLIEGANIVWYGDLRIKPNREKSSWLGSSTRVSNSYFLGFQAALTFGPIDELLEVRFDKKTAAYASSVVGDKLQLEFDLPKLFGGETERGGIVGTMDFYLGTDTQTANDYLERVIGKSLPGYRNVAYAVGRQLGLGTSNFLPAPSFITRWCPNSLGLTAGRHNINGLANPACMIYEVAINTTWGVGLLPGQVDVTALRAMGNTLYAEGFGLALMLDNVVPAEEWIDEILRHVDGVRFTDRASGLLSFALIRDDYDPDTVLTLGADELVSCELEVGGWETTANDIRVQYTGADFETKTIPYPNLANYARRGELDTETYEFLGIQDPDVAALVAARVAKGRNYPLIRGRIEVDRSAYDLRIGSPFRLEWPPLNLTGAAAPLMRVQTVQEGELESGIIAMDVLQDIFSIDDVAYATDATEWQDPSVDALADVAHRVIEAPYHYVPGANDVLLWALVVRANNAHIGMELWTDRGNTGSAFVQTNDVSAFCPSGLLAHDYDPQYNEDSSGLLLTVSHDLESLESVTEDEFRRGRNLLLIDDELFAWRDVIDNGNGTFSIERLVRGVLDTVPRPHAAGARVWFLTESRALADPLPIIPDQAVGVRALPYTGRDVLPLASASTFAITTVSRASRPYPPGNFRIDGDFNPGTVVGNLVITWNHRNRLTSYAQDDIVEQDDVGTYTAEGDYQIEFWINGALRRTVNPSGGTTTFTYTEAMRATDFADHYLPVEVRGYSRNGSLLSAFYQRVVVDQVIGSV